MKKMMVVLFAATLAFAAGADILDHWVYDSTAKTISDNVWTFNATLAKDKVSLTVGTSITRDSSEWTVTPLNFSKPVVDASANEYKIVTINTGFSTYDGSWAFRVKPYPEAGRVGELSLPDGLVTISSYAFGSCTNLTLSGGFPTSLEKIDDYSFSSTKLSGDIVLAGLKDIGVASFGGTQITSLRFGPNLATVRPSYGRGTFQSCKLLTNVVFDAQSSITSIGEFTFYGCSALRSIDLSAVRSFISAKADNSPFGNCLSLERIILGSGVTSLPASALYTSFNQSQLGALTQVRFRGLPPQSIGTPFLSGQPTTRSIATIVELDPNSTEYDYDEALEAWGALTAGGTINDSDSTWSETYAGSCFANRPLLLASPQHISIAKGPDLDISYHSQSSFTFSRAAGDSVGAPRPVYFTISGTAVSGVDYKPLAESVVIPAGEQSVTVPVTAIYNPGLTDARTITITITPWDEYTILTGTVTITLTRSKDFAGWIYDKTDKVITRGDWTFGATVGSDGRSLTVGKWVQVPETAQPLDFSGLILDGNGNYYDLVVLNPQFGYSNNSSGYLPVGYFPQCERVGALTLPQEGLREIGACAFTDATNLTLTANDFGALTTIGDSVFCRCKLIVGDLMVTNLISLGFASFKETSVSSFRFGRPLSTINHNYSRGAFQGCQQLTNIVFDAESSIVRIGQFTFRGCSALTEFDLRAVRSFQDPTKTENSAFNGCSSMKKITLGAIACVQPYALSGMANLEEVVFVDVPPVGTFTNYLNGASAGKTIVTRVSKKYLDVPNAAGVCWRDLAVGGEIRRRGTTWKSDYLVSGVDPAKRPLLLLEPYGLQIILR